MKKIGCLIFLGIFFVVLLFLGGAAYFGYKTVDETVGWDVAKRAISGGANTIQGLVKGELRLRVPDELWQNEVKKVFPIEDDVGGFVSLTISNPQFIEDPDPAWLRVSVDLQIQVKEGQEFSFPGQAVVRTQLRYEKESLRVLLHNPELAEFTFGGQGAGLADSLKPVIAEVLASDLQEFEVLDLNDQVDLEQIGGAVEHLRDVVIENRGVVVVIGRKE